MPQQSSTASHGQALEVIAGLDDPLVERDRQLEQRGERGDRFLCPLKRARHEVDDVVIGEVGRDHLSHLVAQCGEMEVGKPAVEHSVGIVDLPMT